MRYLLLCCLLLTGCITVDPNAERAAEKARQVENDRPKGEFATIPPLQDGDLYDAYEAARQAMIGIRIAGDTRGIAAHLSTLPGITYVVSTAGSFDLLVEVVCEDDAHLLSLLTERIRTLPPGNN